jgi:hypothetical protein
MTDRPPIPAGVWQRMLAFLAAGKTGQIVLDVHRGRVSAVSINERYREDEPSAECAPSVQLKTR